MTGGRHEKLWTPTVGVWRPKWMRFLNDCREAAGGHWRDIHYATDVHLRVIRNWRNGSRQRLTASDEQVDLLINTCDPPDWRLEDLPWFTAWGLEQTGLWKPSVAPADRIVAGTSAQVEDLRTRARERERTANLNTQRVLHVPIEPEPTVDYTVVFDGDSTERSTQPDETS